MKSEKARQELSDMLAQTSKEELEKLVKGLMLLTSSGGMLSLFAWGLAKQEYADVPDAIEAIDHIELWCEKFVKSSQRREIERN